MYRKKNFKCENSIRILFIILHRTRYRILYFVKRYSASINDMLFIFIVIGSNMQTLKKTQFQFILIFSTVAAGIKQNVAFNTELAWFSSKQDKKLFVVFDTRIL